MTMKPCDASPDCLHEVCVICRRLLRQANLLLREHPGTTVGTVLNNRCKVHRETDADKARLAQIRHENTVAGLNKFLERIKGASKVKAAR